jgi:2-polyprenyl-3-methyl-5-hydroxy-6-metoxy-1,4-benzoquinol methylase
VSVHRATTAETTARSDDSVRWTTVAVDPNGHEAIALRRRQLDAITLLEMPRSRVEFLIDVVHGKRVLDIGCVDHSRESELNPWFLHRAIVQAAEHCLGVDMNEEGIEHLHRRGFNVLRADLTDPRDRREIAERGPFDVIVAGEVIEHLEMPSSLFELAASCLAGDGRMIITTPNPYAPHRVVSGRKMVAWENVDHLFYVFPSGVVELASRSGLVVEAATTTGSRSLRYRSLLLVGWAKARLRALTRHRVAEAQADSLALPLLEILSLFRLSRGSRKWIGENAIYVVKRAR